MKRPLLACLLVLVMALAGVAPAVAQESVDRDRLDAAVSAVVDKHHLAGLALTVVDDAGVVQAEGYGSTGDGRAVTPDTPMVIGSVTKSFTAVAVLQLVEQGLVDLDAPVRTYLPWFAVADPAASEAITVRDLLAHTSGLSEFGYNRVLDPDTTLDEGVRDLRSARPTAPVGDTYQYFSPNYWVLALGRCTPSRPRRSCVPARCAGDGRCTSQRVEPVLERFLALLSSKPGASPGRSRQIPSEFLGESTSARTHHAEDDTLKGAAPSTKKRVGRPPID